MPSARESIATAVMTGGFASVRKASLRARMALDMAAAASRGKERRRLGTHTSDRVAAACDLMPFYGVTENVVIMPASRWSFTWQWNNHVPGLSGTMSNTFILAGKISRTSVRIPAQMPV